MAMTGDDLTGTMTKSDDYVSTAIGLPEVSEWPSHM